MFAMNAQQLEVRKITFQSRKSPFIYLSPEMNCLKTESLAGVGIQGFGWILFSESESTSTR